MAIAASGCICCVAPGSGSPDSNPVPAQTAYPGDSSTELTTPWILSCIPLFNSLPAVTNTPTPKPTPIPDISRLPTGTYIARSVISGEGELVIENYLEEDAVILMAQEINPKKAIIGVYIRAGESFTVTGIPDGSYIIYDQLGQGWGINTNHFISQETCGRFDQPLSYETTSDLYTSYRLTLDNVAGGNAETSKISSSEMPSV